MHAPFAAITVALAAIAVQPPPALAQTTPSQAPAGSDRHKAASLEMDTKGSADAGQPAGPNTTTSDSDINTGDRSGSDGATVATPAAPPLLTPAPPSPAAPRPVLQPGGVSTAPPGGA